MLKLIQNFKKQSNLWMFGAFVFLFYGATKPLQPAGVIDHFKVGDVVYSVLDEAKFTQLHGSGWVLMDGRLIGLDKDLRKTFGFTNVPDGRGVFIRSMNEGRDKSTGDPDTDANGKRILSSYQADAFKSHTHLQRTDRLGAANAQGAFKYAGAPASNAFENVSNMLSETGGAETRPRNIALYTYIKIHE